MDEKQAFYVESTDGRKFKMVIRGDLGKLSVAKIRRYLKSYGVPDSQEILAGSLVLQDDMLGEHFGLQNEGVLHLRDPVPPPHSTVPATSLGATPSAAATAGAAPVYSKGLSYGDQSQAYHPQHQSRTESSSPKALSGPGLHGTQTLLPQDPQQAIQQQLRDVQRSLDAANARNAELESQLEQARRSSAVRSKPTASGEDGLVNAKSSLAMLADKLHASLQFDTNLTCVVGTDEDFSILLTYDPATERLYLYSTLLTELPRDPQVRMKLYEVLLEGSLLGREVCGGGIGVSTKNNVVVLTTSLPVKHCQPAALCEVMPAFVETLGRWRSLVMELVL
jgi:hypothetical protein